MNWKMCNNKKIVEDKGIPFWEEMDFFSRVMSFGEKLGRKKIKPEPSSECIRIYKLQDEINALLKGNHYVARSEYAEIIPVYKDIVEYFRVLQNSKMLKNYCTQNGIRDEKYLFLHIKQGNYRRAKNRNLAFLLLFYSASCIPSHFLRCIQE